MTPQDIVELRDKQALLILEENKYLDAPLLMNKLAIPAKEAFAILESLHSQGLIEAPTGSRFNAETITRCPHCKKIVSLLCSTIVRTKDLPSKKGNGGKE